MIFLTLISIIEMRWGQVNISPVRSHVFWNSDDLCIFANRNKGSTQRLACSCTPCSTMPYFPSLSYLLDSYLLRTCVPRPCVLKEKVSSILNTQRTYFFTKKVSNEKLFYPRKLSPHHRFSAKNRDRNRSHVFLKTLTGVLNRGTQRQFSEKYLFGRRFEI